MRVLGSGVRVTVPPSWAAPGLLPRAIVTGLPSGLLTWTPSFGFKTSPRAVVSGWPWGRKLSWAGSQRSSSASTASRVRPFALGGRGRPRRSRLHTLLRRWVLFIAASPHFRDHGGSPPAGRMVGREGGTNAWSRSCSVGPWPGSAGHPAWGPGARLGHYPGGVRGHVFGPG